MTIRKKLIEVALPLEAINSASAREKSIRHGHPSTLHLWWARRPLAAARAVIFAQMVDDPSAHPDLFPTEKKQGKERQRLFKIIEDLVQWENTNNETVLQRARDEIWQSWRYACAENVDHPRAKELFDRNKLPAFHDPFAGGGALPLEAQRLGLKAFASDLNPVAVLINKAMIEIPPKFAGKRPVNPKSQADAASAGSWRGASGLAEDVRYYGQWIRDEAQQRLRKLYPPIEVTADMAKSRADLKPYIGRKLTVVAWLWVRTVKSPNPAFANVEVPLASTFMLSTKAGKEAYVQPVVGNGGYRFTVKLGRPRDPDAAKKGTKLSRGANFACLMSGTPIEPDYIKNEGTAGGMGVRLLAIVAEGERERIYLDPSPEHEEVASAITPDWRPDAPLPDDPRNFWTVQYGLVTYGDLFTPRQLVVLTTFADLVGGSTARVRDHAASAGLPDDGVSLRDGGSGASAYAEAVAVYLAFALDKVADRGSSLGRWDPTPTQSGIINTFSRQALPMTWDFAESNPLGDASGNYAGAVDLVAKALLAMPLIPSRGYATQGDAATQVISVDKVVSTDPPYYDNIAYADLSDFFYLWLRRSLRTVFPEIFATLAVPKAEELVATPYRHGGKEKAETFFLDGMTHAMHRLSEQAHPAFPVTIYYAYKQSETESAQGVSSTGWETFLDAVIRAGFSVSGTWPMRTELGTRMISAGTNALASSIILVCTRRPTGASTATRREFITVLKTELPVALAHLQRGNIAPVDLAQAAIGPGMGVYTRYTEVLDPEGKVLTVGDALALINQTLDESLSQQEGDFDADSRWAITWFEENGFNESEFGRAEQLSKSRNTSVEGMRDAGIIASKRSKVRLLKPEELPEDWDPQADIRPTAWQSLHQLIRALNAGGEAAAAELVKKLGSRAETARELAYRLYAICQGNKRAADALAYNSLVQSWTEIARIAKQGLAGRPEAGTEPDLFR
jgi:putative DNA methylase